LRNPGIQDNQPDLLKVAGIEISGFNFNLKIRVKNKGG
jgi:hypothetical protein